MSSQCCNRRTKHTRDNVEQSLLLLSFCPSETLRLPPFDQRMPLFNFGRFKLVVTTREQKFPNWGTSTPEGTQNVLEYTN